MRVHKVQEFNPNTLDVHVCLTLTCLHSKFLRFLVGTEQDPLTDMIQSDENTRTRFLPHVGRFPQTLLGFSIVDQ